MLHDLKIVYQEGLVFKASDENQKKQQPSRCAVGLSFSLHPVQIQTFSYRAIVCKYIESQGPKAPEIDP